MKKKDFIDGLKDGLPIGFGYFAVSFALGIQCKGNGLSWLFSTLLSLFNLTSAGEEAVITMLGNGTTYIAIFLITLVVNLRYLLMSCSLSQKVYNMPLYKKMIIGYGITDEIFAISIARANLTMSYIMGALCMAVPCWTIGTFLGVLAGNIFPEIIVKALSLALYGMFLAIILPPAKKSKPLFFVIIASSVMSACFYYIPLLKQVLGDYAIIIIVFVVCILASVLAPVKEEKNG